MYRDLDHVEKCGFLHGAKHVLNDIFEVFLDIAKFEVVGNGTKLILPERTGITLTRIHLHCHLYPNETGNVVHSTYK